MAETDRAAFAELMAIRSLPRPAPGEVAINGADPFYQTPFRIGETVAAVLAASGVAANDLWELRTGQRQRIGIDVRDAAASLHVVHYTRQRNTDGSHFPAPQSPSMRHMASITQHWQTADGGWFLPHFNLPHLERRVLDVLNCESTPEAVSHFCSMIESSIVWASSQSRRAASPDAGLLRMSGYLPFISHALKNGCQSM